MRWKRSVFVALTARLCWRAPAWAPVPVSPATTPAGSSPGRRSTRLARQFAAVHCAGYGKRARITSMRAQYGEYIAFACSWR